MTPKANPVEAWELAELANRMFEADDYDFGYELIGLANRMAVNYRRQSTLIEKAVIAIEALKTERKQATKEIPAPAEISVYLFNLGELRGYNQALRILQTPPNQGET